MQEQQTLQKLKDLESIAKAFIEQPGLASENEVILAKAFIKLIGMLETSEQEKSLLRTRLKTIGVIDETKSK